MKTKTKERSPSHITPRGYRPFASFRGTILARGWGTFSLEGRNGILCCRSRFKLTNLGVKTKNQKKRFRRKILGFVLAFNRVFLSGTRLYLRLGSTSSDWGDRSRNALQWYRTCYFLLGHNTRLGGTRSDLGGHGPEMAPPRRRAWFVFRKFLKDLESIISGRLHWVPD